MSERGHDLPDGKGWQFAKILNNMTSNLTSQVHDGTPMEEHYALLAHLEKIEGIDTVKGVHNLSGDVVSYLRLLCLLYVSLAKDMKKFVDHLKAGEYKQASAVAHALKGAAGTLGLVQIQILTNELAIAQVGNVDKMSVQSSDCLVGKLNAELNKLHDVLAFTRDDELTE
jgi:HPt (histidine-containing phosphotransfer) domain-containing protein